MRLSLVIIPAAIVVAAAITCTYVGTARRGQQPLPGVVGSQHASPIMALGKDSDWSHSRSVDARVTSTAVHGAPTVTLTPSDRRIDITWTPAVNADSYTIYRSTSSGVPAGTQIATGVDTEPYSDTGLTNGVTYYYQVAGVSGGTELTKSSEIGVAPTDFTPQAVKLTRPGAIAIANTFCRSIGVSASGTPAVVFPYSDSRGGMHMPEHNYMTRWKVSYPSGVEVEVADATSQVVGFFVFTRGLDSSPAGQAIPKAKALAIANEVLAAAGVTTGMAPNPRIDESQIAMPPKAETHSWWFYWQRATDDGVPYRDDMISVMLQAESGAPKALGINFHSAAPAAAVSKVSADDAYAAAKAKFATLKLETFGAPQKPVEMIVRANGFPEKPRSFDSPPGPCRYAWVCNFAIKRGYVELWVDIETGEVIGGDIAVAG